MLESELTTHLGYGKHDGSPPGEPPNARNGHSAKTLRSDDGKLAIKVPRDRNGGFEPSLVPKHQRHFDGFDEATGVLTLRMRGACAGCPSSSATLKAGVEQMMKHYIPEVTSVEQVI